MKPTPKTLVSTILAAALLALVAAGPVAAAAPDEAGCVGQYASTGGTSGGSDFAAVIRGFAQLPGPFGTVVAIEAHGERSLCPFTYPGG
jgi:hypothetical protein